MNEDNFVNRVKNLFVPQILITAGGLAAVTISSAFFDIRLFYICLGVSLFCAALLFWQIYQAKRDVSAVLMSASKALTTVQKEALSRFPLGVFICARDGEVLWCNQIAKTQVLDGKSTYDLRIGEVIPKIDVAAPCPPGGYEVRYLERHYAVYTTPAQEHGQEFYVVYFVEDTALYHYAQEYFESRTCMMIILLDNYDELQGLKDNQRTRLAGQIEYTISKYISEHNGVMLKSERDRFTVVVEERALRNMIASRFELLEQIRSADDENNVIPTLSIGVARDCKTLVEAEQSARQALDMALGRGGDQAAVRSKGGYEFFGGVSTGVEKRTKVKARIVANALTELIRGSDNVILMGHRLADLDCFGACVGLLKAAQMMGKQSYIAIRRNKNMVQELYSKLEDNGYEGLFLEPEHAYELITKKTLLIICDTHNKQILESTQIYEACQNIVVIDHHRKMVGHIDNAVIFYHEPFASSASEMVAELVQYFGEKAKIGRLEAEALLAGIMLDTKNFVLKTGVRTFEAAAYLRKIGADTVEVKRLFSSSMDAYQRKVKLVAGANVYRGCAIASCPDKDIPDIQVVAAQAADELLGISGVQASFLLYEQAGMISFSARSMGQMNVQVIMERLGGGGHLTMAGAQLSGVGFAQAKEMLMKAIDQYFEENTRTVK